MLFEWDADKVAKNLGKHGIPFDRIVRLDWEGALTAQDERADYGEERFVTYGRIEGRLHVVVWTPRCGVCRLISLRKANEREELLYVQAPEG